MLTAVEQQDDNGNNGVDDFLPCLEDDPALVLSTIAIRDLAAVKELLARVCEVVEYTLGSGGEEDE